MKGLVLFLFAALVVSAAVAFVDDDTKKEFRDHQHRWGRNYSSSEYLKREAIYAKNKAKRAAHHLRFKSGEVGWDTTATEFADLTSEEFIRGLGYWESNSTDAISAEVYYANTPSKRFDELDWRSRGKVGNVKNQGHCGSCWAFATTSSVESCIAINKNVQPPNLSEQQLQDCMFAKVCSPGGGGGATAIDWVKKNGIAFGQEYPYTQSNGNCHTTQKKASVGARVHGKTEDQLLKMLQTGPVLIGINASPLQSYKSGVVNDAGLSKGRNHAVTVVGVTGNCDGKAQQCWIIKNSWGPGWGEKGFFRVAKGQSIIGLGDDSDLPTGCSQDGSDNGGGDSGNYGPTEDGDRWGGDVATTTAGSSAECQKKCAQNKDCTIWSFDTCGNSCWLKNNKAKGLEKVKCRASGTITKRN